jgi:CheY-like chemotaxis protein
MAEDQQETSASQESVHPQSLKAVLVVDDDKQLASALQWILADENYLVDVAYDGEEALLKVKVHEYDVVICDLLMPRLRGDEFYFRATELRPALAERFIFITGFAADSENKRFLSEQGQRHLVKPFQIDQLIDAVKELLATES